LSILFASKSNGTWGQYYSSWEKWSKFCQDKSWSEIDSDVEHVLLFLTNLFDNGLSYSTINSSKSALSSMLTDLNGTSIGQHKMILQFMKWVARLRPPVPRYSVVSHPDTVLSLLKSWDVSSCRLQN